MLSSAVQTGSVTLTNAKHVDEYEAAANAIRKGLKTTGQIVKRAKESLAIANVLRMCGQDAAANDCEKRAEALMLAAWLS